MNKKQILASLNMIANSLDNNHLYNEANSITKVMKRLAEDIREEDFGTRHEYFQALAEQQKYQERPPHPEEIQKRKKVEELYPIFEEKLYEWFDTVGDDLSIPFGIAINWFMISFVFSSKDPKEYIQKTIVDSESDGYIKQFYEQNFSKLVELLNFIKAFMQSNQIDAGIMERLIQKIYQPKGN